MPSDPTPRVGDLVPWTRQVTGRGYCHHGYVIEHHGNVLEACSHRHRSARTAMECAKRMVRLRKLVELANAGDVEES